VTIHKCTLFFEATTWGWSESYWYNSGTGTHVSTMGELKKLATARAQLLGNGAFVKARRVSTEGVGPDAYLVYDNITPTFKTDADGKGVVEELDHEDAAVLVRCNNADFRVHKHIFLRGIWDSIDINHGKYAPNASWNARMLRFLNALSAGQWGWWGVTNRLPKVPMTTYAPIASGQVRITFQEAVFPANTIDKKVKVRISGVNGKSVLNGEQLVVPESMTSCVTLKPLGVTPYRFGGYGSYAEYGFIGISSAEDQKIVERKAGAPLLQSRGRQRARARG
jgi:hypothetical protein